MIRSKIFAKSCRRTVKRSARADQVKASRVPNKASLLDRAVKAGRRNKGGSKVSRLTLIHERTARKLKPRFSAY